MSVNLLTEQHLEFLSLTGGCTGSTESTLVKLPHCWKSYATAQLMISDTSKPTLAYIITPLPSFQLRNDIINTV